MNTADYVWRISRLLSNHELAVLPTLHKKAVRAETSGIR
jgi:hypothetical protein